VAEGAARDAGGVHRAAAQDSSRLGLRAPFVRRAIGDMTRRRARPFEAGGGRLFEEGGADSERGAIAQRAQRLENACGARALRAECRKSCIFLWPAHGPPLALPWPSLGPPHGPPIFL